MIWTGSPGQIATTMTIFGVPLSLYLPITVVLQYHGAATIVAEAIAGTVTVAWVAIIATPDVRAEVTKAIFPDERDGECCYQCGVGVERCDCGQDRDGHELRRVGARVRDRVPVVVGS